MPAIRAINDNYSNNSTHPLIMAQIGRRFRKETERKDDILVDQSFVTDPIKRTAAISDCINLNSECLHSGLLFVQTRD